MEALKLAIQQAVTTGFVDETTTSLLDYRPSIITNDPIINEKVLTTLLEELRQCSSFFLSVAFITTGGVSSLFGTLLDLQEKGVRGKILVSEYLNFTEPEAMRKLLQLDNIELRIARELDFHSKGFLFTHQSYHTIIIGSSNITHGALTKNKEWNLKVTAHKDSELFRLTIHEFENIFEQSYIVTEEYLVKYTFIHNSEKRMRSQLRKELLNTDKKEIQPNEMQKKALSNLVELREKGANKALLVSATGTGKTYLSAFDVALVKPKRMLFLVHRLNIAQKSLETFQSITPGTIKMGLYSGKQRNTSADYIFSTVQTLSKDNHLHNFSPNDFDYIIIDETHRASAASYQTILNYFKPTFLLGMTATPERSDNLDVFRLFDYNIASEIRLHEALALEMLVPFHYFGVSEIEINGNLLDDKATINDLNRQDRAKHIIEKINLFGTDNGITRGLVFCSKQEECHYLSEAFNNEGFKTLSLTASSNEEERSRAIDLLETDDESIKLDYIFTVDIFNEGIDIPRVNQVIMLRPTQSAIIFIQQLGRGLRKREGKSYVTVIDFIGNYQQNFLVPIALFGDRSYVPDTLRKLVNQPEKALFGASTIYFDRIVKERIFHSIDTGRLQEKRKLVEAYTILKGKIGRIPLMMDFVEHAERDPFQYIENYDSYYSFLLLQKEEISEITIKEKQAITFLSKEVLNAIRHIEAYLLEIVIKKGGIEIEDLKHNYLSENGRVLTDATILHALHHINGLFTTAKDDKKIKKIGIIHHFDFVNIQNDKIIIGRTLFDLCHIDDVKNHLIDLCQYVNFSLSKKGHGFANNDFILNQKYTRKDVFRILQWDENPVAQNVGGYMISKDKKDCALFVNYEKDEEISASTKYHDRFTSRNEFIWMSKNKRKLTSADVTTIISQPESNIRIPLFVKKSLIEGISYYYLGNIKYQKHSAVEKSIPDDKGGSVSVVEMKFTMEVPVEKALFNYLLSSN